MADVDDDFADTERFKVLRRLGKGGMGVVYEVFDAERDQHVALKTLKRLSANAVLRFKNEFRALQNLHHPNLVRLEELFEKGGKWFFTMELIEGVSLLEYVRSDGGKPGPTPDSGDGEMPTLPTDGPVQAETPKAKNLPRGYDEDRLRKALLQLSQAVYALHQTHQVHRDIKPSNILVTASGVVKLLDFGLVTEAAEKRIWADDHLVGTVSYMAPEQAAQRPVGPAADWYSVGVLLYQALTGKLPVRGTTEEVLFLKQAIEPPAPSVHARVPEDLEQLCTSLLRIDPAARPDGADILRRLAPLEVESIRPARSFFVGRESELSRLREAFAEMRLGKRIAVLVDGESGVGKSVIVERFIHQLRREHPSVVTLLGRCYERESVPYKAVDGAIDSLARYLTTLPSIAVARLMPEHMGLVGKVFPVLRRIEAIARATRPPDNLDPLVLRARLFVAFRELWRRLARVVPLVIVIDDLQWADEESLALLDEMLREPEAPALLLVATVRAASKNEIGFRNVTELAARIGGEVRTIHVGTLPPEDANELVRSLSEGTSVDLEEDATLIADAAGGHPLFIDELVRQRRMRKGGSGPARLDDALYARASALDETARHVLSIVALAGSPLPQETAAVAADLDFGTLARIVTPLRAQNLIRTGGARRVDLVEPYHDRVRVAVVERLEPKVRRVLHGRLASALEASGKADLESLSFHFEGAGDVDRAAEYAERAADVAAQKLAFDRAARLYQHALELRPRSAADGSAIRTKLGHALANAGRGAEAARVYLAAVEGAPAPDVLDLRRRVAEQLLRSGLIDEGIGQLRVVLASIGMKLPRSPWTAVISFLLRRIQVRLRGIHFQERVAANIPPETLVRVDICWSAGIALGMVDTVRGAHFQARGLLVALQAGEPYRVARALAGEAGFAAAAGGPARERAEMLLAAAKGCAEKVGHPFVLSWAALAEGIGAYLLGEFRRCYDACIRAKALLEGCTGVAWERETADVNAIMSAFYLGRIKDQIRMVERGRREADERSDLFASTYVRSGLAIMSWLARDDVSGARREIQSTIEKWSQRGYFLAHFWCFIASAQIELYEGAAEKTYERVRDEWGALTRSLLPRSIQIVRIEALHLRARGAVAVALRATGQKQAKLLREAERDAARLEAENMAYATPMATLIRSAVAFQRNEKDQAVRLLDAAAMRFSAADMPLFERAAFFTKASITGDSALVASAENWMREEDIVVPEKMVAMLAPGFRRSV